MKDEMLVIALGSIPFFIDKGAQELIQTNNQNNRIPISQLNHDGDSYSLEFDDARARIVLHPPPERQIIDDLISISIPAIIIDAPDSISEKHRQELNISSKELESGFFIADQITAERLSGKLPHIDLAGTDFTVDWRLKELRETDEPWKNISLRHMVISDDGESYLCFFNTVTHELYEPDEETVEMPENTVLLTIPYEIILDPVAVAREHGLCDTDLLVNHPIQSNLKATVKPLSESGLAEFIADNRKGLNESEDDDQNYKRGR